MIVNPNDSEASPFRQMPSYLAVTYRLLEDVWREGLGPGSPLPSVRVLARRYGISEGTVVRAFKYLIKEGICYSVSRRGMFLKEAPPPTQVGRLTVGLVLYYERYREEDNPFYRMLYEGAEMEAGRRSYNVLSLHSWRRKDPMRKSREIEEFCRNLAGFVALGVYSERDCLRLRDSGVPTVAVDYETLDLGLDCVVIDNAGIIRALCERVLEAGPGSVFLADLYRSADYDPAVTARRRAFTETMTASGRECGESALIVLDGPGNGREGVARLISAASANGRIPAIVCTDDFAARRLLAAIGEEGPAAGRDFLLAYIGPPQPAFADLEGVPALVGAVDFRELGREGVRMLEERIARGPGRAERRTVGGRVIEWMPGRPWCEAHQGP